MKTIFLCAIHDRSDQSLICDLCLVKFSSINIPYEDIVYKIYIVKRTLLLIVHKLIARASIGNISLLQAALF